MSDDLFLDEAISRVEKISLLPNNTKIGIGFLRMIAKELGVRRVEAINFTSWELTDCIIKDIHLRDIETKRLKSCNKSLEKKFENLCQLNFFVYPLQLESLGKGEEKKNEPQTKEASEVE